ncbi:MAG TPA: hypothetical protein VD996_11755 [Chitinophagaceae bacterium]|nr:hypothetical protein [Chitinophagaceae bacterium]
MTHLPGEEQLIASNGGKIILTNLRVYMKEKEGTGYYVNSIFLEEISSVELRFKSNISLAWLGPVAIMAGLLLYNNAVVSSWAPGLLILTGVVLLALYFISRKRVVCITSRGGSSLNFDTAKISGEEVEKFMTNVQEAKLKRIHSLSGQFSL